jgi:hypothetical protein
MQLTTAGQIFLAASAASLVSAYWLGRRVSARLQPGKGTSTFIVIVLFALIALFAPFTYWTGQALYGLATKPSYSATVVSYTSEYRDYDEEDANGRKVRRTRLMHTPQVRFTGPDGAPVELPSSVASSGIPVVGEQLTVVFAPGDTVAAELSARSVGLWLGAGVMLFILGYCLWAAVWYGMGRPMAGVATFGTTFLFRFLLPVVTLLMTAALGYTAFKYFALGNPDGFPRWVGWLCTLFTLALLPLLVTLFKREKNEEE